MQAEPPAVIGTLVGLLRKCRAKKDLLHAQRLHAHLCSRRLDSHPVLGNYLVPLLADCGSLHAAQLAFDRLPCRSDERSWTALISAYINARKPQHALHLYCRMQAENSAQPNKFTYLALLHACARLEDPENTRVLHAETALRGLESELYLGSTLVDTYAKCGLLDEARQVFGQLTTKDAVSWNALITGYAEHGPVEEVLMCYKQMQLEGVSADAFTFACGLKACGMTGDLVSGQEMHDEAVKRGWETELYIGSTLVDMYSKCVSLVEARQVFDRMPRRNAVAWNALIAGYADHQLGDEAKFFFQQMQEEGVSPDSITYLSCLKVCLFSEALETGQDLHTEVIKRGMEKDSFMGSTFIDLYTKYYFFDEAKQILKHLPARCTVTWNALITGYSAHGLGEEVLDCFQQMQLDGISPDSVTFTCSLKACGIIEALETGQKIHTEITHRALEQELYMGSTLVDVYNKCNSIIEARHVFDSLQDRDTVSWNALIAGYAERGCGKEVLAYFKKIQLESVAMDTATFVGSLKACGSIKALETGRQIHFEATIRGLEREPLEGNAVVDMYARCGSLAEAQDIFDRLSVQHATAWNALITGYAEHGCNKDVLNCFRRMQLAGVSIDAVAFVGSLKACGNLEALETGHEIHAEIAKRGFESELYIRSTLVDLYSKCSSFAEARHLLDRLSIRNAVSWSALIAGYAKQGLDGEVLTCFQEMQLEGLAADADVYVICLKACGMLGALNIGREIHAEIKRLGLERDSVIGNMLIEMYGRCGSPAEAREVFDKLPVRDVSTWTAMIKAYGDNHKADMAILCFEEMQQQGLKPDSITFTCLLAACSHSSLIQKGQEYFKVMREHYDIEPTSEHYACIVELFVRSGKVLEMGKFLAGVQCQPSSYEIVMNLLSACKIYGELELGERCFQQLVEMKQEDAASYLLMAEIYAGAGRCNDASRIEETRRLIGSKKKPGSAIIELNNMSHEFVVGTNQSEDMLEILGSLGLLMKGEGYVPKSHSYSIPISHEEKEVTFHEFFEACSLCLQGNKDTIVSHKAQAVH